MEISLFHQLFQNQGFPFLDNAPLAVVVMEAVGLDGVLRCDKFRGEPLLCLVMGKAQGGPSVV